MQFRNVHTNDVIAAFGPVADNYAARPDWERVPDATEATLEDMSHEQLDAYATANGVDLGRSKTKAEKVAAILAAAEVPEPAAAPVEVVPVPQAERDSES